MRRLVKPLFVTTVGMLERVPCEIAQADSLVKLHGTEVLQDGEAEP